MIDNKDSSVDGFSDTEGETNVPSPDPGIERKLKPLDPDEYVEAQKEAREEDDKK